ncbi:efflux RND transporter periplasmic adaptor subunit [Sulfobacillus harzensis]|uniref:Efflux RND transporter periplasmic adaptor subunit n=1 Tax=Sulfobacillus harzensis TaxID=2729629 RepID=A0A7Y0L7K5_9FIRM|nr:HlyD family efflux transporter periplasmic adaptor subunit [Sulfobacillus harzensis]NMP24777.1 efflux RND transporter periplasmic adaptor subunit [Sulfobacillus harzensis]
MKSRVKLWAWVGVGVVVVGGGVGYWATRQHYPTAAATGRLAAYLAEAAQQGTFEGQISASGTIAPTNEATVQSPQTGQISQIHVKLGQTVTQGETVATLTGGQTVTSPIAGTVVSLDASAGSYVSAGETLLIVANMNTVYAQVTVSEDDVRNVKVGDTVKLTLPALPNKSYSGTVTTVGDLGSSGSSGTVTYPVTVTVSNPSGILLGMSVTATIDTGTITDAVYVPTSAIETVNGQEEVLVPKKSLPTPSFGSGGFGGTGAGGFGGGGFGGRGSSSARGSFSRTATTVPVAKAVVVGLTNGSDTQIVSGLSAHQQILVPNPAAQTSSGASSPTGRFGGGFGVGGFGGPGLGGGFGG